MFPLRSPAAFDWMFFWTTVVIATTVVQVLLIAITDDETYWLWYHTSTDILELALTCALFCAVPYPQIVMKMTVAGLTVWQLYCASSQFVSDYLLVTNDPLTNPNAGMMVAFFTASLAIAWLMRFLVYWRPCPAPVSSSKFHEVIGRPSNLSQMGVAMYTGRGGSFAITDGTYLWRYSRQEGCMMRKTLNPGYMVGKMSVEICMVTDDKYDELDSMTGRKFSLLHNCLELQTLARRWR